MTHGQAVEIVTAYAVDASIKDGNQPVALRQALEHFHEIDREHERDEDPTVFIVAACLLIAAWGGFGLGFLFGWGLTSMPWQLAAIAAVATVLLVCVAKLVPPAIVPSPYRSPSVK
jgi:hypothetical protein